MKTIESHDSLDGLLRLIVVADDNGDTSIGFEGLSWHTHGEIEAEIRGTAVDAAIRQFVDEILYDETVIAVSFSGETLKDAWPTDDPQEELKYKSSEESIKFRFWSGRTAWPAVNEE